MKERTPDRTQYKTLTQRLSELDKDLADILAQRASLYAKALSAERKDRSGGAEAAIDRILWPIWQERMTTEGLDAKLWHQIFTLANTLGLESGRTKAQGSEGFVLKPKRDPVSLDLPGPPSNLQARLLSFLAGVTGQPLTLSAIILNDGLFELAKGLNSLGAGFSWTTDSLSKEQTKPISLEGESIFCGHDPLNFFLLLGHGLAFPGRVRFSGGSDLKLLDLRALAPICLKLGARLSSVDTKSSGLPARLETGGPVTSLLELDAADLPADVDTPGIRDLVIGLAMSAWAYPDGLTITWPKGDPLTLRLQPVRTVLGLCGVEATVEDGQFQARRSTLRVPSKPVLDLDPLLSAVLLAMPAANGGRTRLAGPWPQDPCADAALALLRDAGLTVSSQPGVTMSEAKAPAGPRSTRTLDTRACPHYLPLALALAALAPGRTEILLAPGADTADAATGLLGRLGLPFTLEQDRLVVEAGGSPAGFARPWLSPAPEYSLALSLIALRAPSLALANPSGLSALWPSYWAVYNRLPAVSGALIEKQDDKENEAIEPAKKGRRIRIGGDSSD